MSDDRDFQLLDDYVERLHGGTFADRRQLLTEHPELESALRCLEALEKLAPLRANHRAWRITRARLATRSRQTADQTGEVRPISTREFGDYELLGGDRPRRHGCRVLARGSGASIGLWP